MTEQHPSPAHPGTLGHDADPSVSHQGGGLRANTLGTASIVFFVVAAASPLTGVAGGLPVSFALGNGDGVAALYGVAALVLLIFSVGYAAMSRRMINAGAFYAYVGRGIGPWAGIMAAFLAMLSYLGMMVAVYALFGSSTSDTLKAHFGWDIPWWVLSLVVLAIVTFFGHRQVDLSAKVLGVFMLCEVIFVLVIDFAILGKGGDHGVNLSGFSWESISQGAPGVALLFGFASFVGYEATALYGEEVRDPKRTVARATYIAVILIGVFYVFTAWAFSLASKDVAAEAGALLEQNAGPGLLFGNAANYVAPWTSNALEILLMTSLFAALVAFHNGISRYVFALAREKVFPPVLGQTHPQHDSPYLASALTGAFTSVALIASVVIGLQPMAELFAWSSAVGTLGVLVLQAATSLAVFMYFKKSGQPESLWQTAIAPLIALAGLLFALLLAISNFSVFTGGSDTQSLLLMLLVPAALAVGLAVALVMKNKRPDMYAEVGADMR